MSPNTWRRTLRAILFGSADRLKRIEANTFFILERLNPMSDALQTLTDSVNAILTAVDNNDTELAAIAHALRAQANTPDNTQALLDLAAKIDTARGKLTAAGADASTALSPPDPAPAETVVAGGGDDSVAAPEATAADTVTGGTGDDSVSGA